LQPEAARLKVPEQLSLATLGSMATEPAPSWSPPLTNLDIDHARTAQCIVEIIQKMIAVEPYPPVLRMPLKLQVTESIGPPPERLFG
jgi:DNA-binding LacI/PurR family transcriptional regulator